VKPSRYGGERWAKIYSKRRLLRRLSHEYVAAKCVKADIML